MLRLLKIDLIKLTNYRPFNVLLILYSFLIISVPIGFMEVLKWLKRIGAEMDEFDPMKIPVLYFPDIWQNVTYVYSYPIVKIFLAMVIVLSVSNEFSYKTVRQNIIDGMSRTDFLISKLSTTLLLSLGSALLVFLTCLLTGMIYSPAIEFADILQGLQFVFVYFLDLLAYLLFAVLLTVLLKRSALTIFILLIYRPIELILIATLPDQIEVIGEYFPMQANANLIEIPFPKYIFQEIQDFITLESILVVVVYVGLYYLAVSRKLTKSDL